MQTFDGVSRLLGSNLKCSVLANAIFSLTSWLFFIQNVSVVLSFRLPKLQVIGEGSEKDIEISDDPYDTVPLDITNVPVLVTLNKVCVNETFCGHFAQHLSRHFFLFKNNSNLM